jgi:L,D-peptidoglycan transpeptidase YkuD (ErfK/YbiS/YcfS/YnhG family)
VPGDWATPTGLFPFGTTVYGNSAVSPTSRYPYHHLVCGDWWDEQPGSPTYDTFQHVTCGITPLYGDDSEALWTEIQPYQHFIDIEMPHPPDNGAGIFLHDDMPGGYTEGCVALPNRELDAVLGWLNPAATARSSSALEPLVPRRQVCGGNVVLVTGVPPRHIHARRAGPG